MMKDVSGRSDRGQESRGLTGFCCLLERIGQPDQRGLAPGAAEEGDSYRQSGDESRGHIDVGISGDSGGVGTASRDVIAIDKVREPSRAASGSNDSIEMMLVHQGVDSFGSRQLVVLLQGVEICLFRERAFGLGLEE